MAYGTSLTRDWTLAVEAQSLNHWTTKEIPTNFFKRTNMLFQATKFVVICYCSNRELMLYLSLINRSFNLIIMLLHFTKSILPLYQIPYSNFLDFVALITSYCHHLFDIPASPTRLQAYEEGLIPFGNVISYNAQVLTYHRWLITAGWIEINHINNNSDEKLLKMELHCYSLYTPSQKAIAL